MLVHGTCGQCVSGPARFSRVVESTRTIARFFLILETTNQFRAADSRLTDSGCFFFWGGGKAIGFI